MRVKRCSERKRGGSNVARGRTVAKVVDLLLLDRIQVAQQSIEKEVPGGGSEERGRI